MESRPIKGRILPLTEPGKREKTFKALALSIVMLISLFVFLNPFPYTTAIKEICFYASLTLILLLAGFRRVKFSLHSPLTVPFALFALWAFIGLFFAIDKENGFHDFQTHLIKYLLLYYIIINYFDSEERLRYLSWTIMISAALFSTGEILYFYVLKGNPLSTKLVTGIPEIAVNGVGIIAIPAIIFGLHNMITPKRVSIRIISVLCLFPAVILCFLTQARGTILAMFLSIIILCFQNKKVLISCLGIVLFFTVMTPSKDRFINMDKSSKLRWGTYCISYEIIKDYPILGIGFGMETYGDRKYIDLEAYNKRIPEKYRGYILADPHSMPFSIAVRTGLPGLLLFLYILFVSFKMGWISIMQGGSDHLGRSTISAFVAVLVIGMFEPFFSHVPEVVFFTLLAMITIVWKLNEGHLSQRKLAKSLWV